MTIMTIGRCAHFPLEQLTSIQLNVGINSIRMSRGTFARAGSYSRVSWISSTIRVVQVCLPLTPPGPFSVMWSPATRAPRRWCWKCGNRKRRSSCVVATLWIAAAYATMPTVPVKVPSSLRCNSPRPWRANLATVCSSGPRAPRFVINGRICSEVTGMSWQNLIFRGPVAWSWRTFWKISAGCLTFVNTFRTTLRRMWTPSWRIVSKSMMYG
mmetsp:Transcript_24290/g.60873  ORF Transcript_24290/g.60873 Transcript_24290/m.60873 type:complete len:212 (-) Transcript_24290:293-928(-)